MLESKENLTNTETDVIGEILSISMTASAEAISNMLDKKVDITVPKVSIKTIDSINYENLEPALCVKISYVEGLIGSNAMVFKQRDMNLILNQLMGSNEPASDDFVFDELSISAACEVMNQMMGASATSLSKLLNRTVNISTPEAFALDDNTDFSKIIDASIDTPVVSVSFDLNITDVMNSEFAFIIPVHLSKELVKDYLEIHGEKFQAQQNVVSNSDHSSNNNVIKEPVKVQMAQFSEFTQSAPNVDERFTNNNMDLIMKVPLTISVEIGKTKKKVKDILEFTEGTVIELDKQAGSPVDIIVNGKLIARGDVVVIEDNFGVRITKILDAKNLLYGNNE